MKITKQFTYRESKSLDQYLQEVAKVELLSTDEEVDLAKMIKRGNEDAREKLVSANLRFVISVAKQFQNQGLSLNDLISEGNIGLIKAAQRFDETRGFKFISYAVWWIRQSIMQAIAEQSRVVRLPTNRIGKLNIISKAYRKLEQEYERKPTIEELAKILEMTPEEISYALRTSRGHISMDAPLKSSEESNYNLKDILQNEKQPLPDKDLLKESLKKDINNALSTLTEKEAEVIKLCFGIGQNHSATLEEISNRFNLTRERVRQIKERAIRNIRRSKRGKKLKAYLG